MSDSQKPDQNQQQGEAPVAVAAPTPSSEAQPTSSISTAGPSSSTTTQGSTEAHERAVRFGLVFTQLGAASKEEVFPHGVRHMPRLLTLKEVTEGKLKRQSLEELDAKIRRTRAWWWPFGWFGPPTAEEIEMRQREAQRKADDALRKKQLRIAMDKAIQADDERKLAELEAKFNPPQPVVEEEPVVVEETAPKTKPKRFPLKVDINTRALTEEEEASLSINVANQRLGILESEKQIHQMLDAIEKTRMQYLRVSSNGIKCEKEIVHLISCYDDAKIKAEKTGNRAAALKCAGLVDALEVCSMEVAKAHIRQ